jgi:hypothetical protein
MIDGALVILQNLAKSEKKRGLCREICPASSQDAYQAISVKVEVPPDAEAEEDPLAITAPGLKAERDVSCVSVSLLGGFR